MNTNIETLSADAEVKNLRAKIDNLNRFLNQDPDPGQIRTNKYANNTHYLPIGYLENKLDEIFQVWEDDIKEVKILGNSIAVTITVSVLNPVTGTFIKRAGVGAMPIELQADKRDRAGNLIEEGAVNALDFEKIQSKAIQKNLPAAKAYAFKNAVQSLGRAFGRSLNRTDETYFEPMYAKRSSTKGEITPEVEIVIEEVNQARDLVELQKVWAKNQDLASNKHLVNAVVNKQKELKLNK